MIETTTDLCCHPHHSHHPHNPQLVLAAIHTIHTIHTIHNWSLLPSLPFKTESGAINLIPHSLRYMVIFSHHSPHHTHAFMQPFDGFQQKNLFFHWISRETDAPRWFGRLLAVRCTCNNDRVASTWLHLYSFPGHESPSPPHLIVPRPSQEISTTDTERIMDLNVHYTGAKKDDQANFLVRVRRPHHSYPCPPH